MKHIRSTLRQCRSFYTVLTYRKLLEFNLDRCIYLFSGIVAEIIMILGYFIFEGFTYGFAPSLVNVPANAIQGASGLVIGCILIKILKRIKLPFLRL